MNYEKDLETLDKTNIICDRCGEHMRTEIRLQFMTNPPRNKLVCICGNEKYVPCEEVEKYGED